jgi:AcrR family transcriptional regulator
VPVSVAPGPRRLSLWEVAIAAGVSRATLYRWFPSKDEVRAMYGGLQMAIGVFALVGAFRARHRDSVLLFFVLALTGLAACRLGGMIAEGESTWLSFSTDIAPGQYNQVGLAMYELPNSVLAWILFLLHRREVANESHAI